MSQPLAGFTVPSTACLSESIQLNNISTQATRYNWDFCHQDLANNPIILQATSLPTLDNFYYSSLRVVYDNGTWTGFATNIRGKLLRLDYGSDINSTPVIVDLGNLNGGLTSPGALDLVNDDGIWFIFITNVFGNNVVRVTLGNGIRSTHTLVESGVVSGSTPIGIKAVANGSSRYLIVSYLGNNSVTVYDFGSSFAGATGSSTTTTNPLFVDLWGIDVISDGTNWYGLTGTSGNGKALRLSFGSNLLNTPSITDIGSIPAATEVKLVKEGLNFFGFVRSRNNGIYRVTFGNDLLQTPIVERLSTTLLQEESRSLEIVRQSPGWKALTMESITGKLLLLDFVGDCGTEMSTESSIEEVPLNLQYTAPGDYYIELSAFDDNVLIAVTNQVVTISSNVVPMINIVVDASRCIGVANTFQVNSSKPLINYTWDFNDSFSASNNPIAHSFANSGVFNVEVAVIDSDGCKINTSLIHKIYSPPVAAFVLPPGLICTNNEFTFTNNTVDNFDGNLSYQWFVENNLEATTRDLKYSFLSNGNKDIKLKTSIPGCSSELTQTLLNVQTGPSVGFDFIGKCENEMIRFNNTSIGNISGYLWDFGNGKTSTIVNEIQTYSSIGTYLVSLQTTGTNGCVSSTSKPLIIYTTPQPDFSLDLPPFSCSGTPSQFNDLTPSPTDSNLSSWSWIFGDVANGISTTRNPTYTYALGGSYNVSLTTTTNFGCSATKLKTIQIAESPKPDFTLGSSCLGKPTLFSDASGANNKSWLWKIGGTSYTIQNPTHVFSLPGNYTGELMVTGNNDCVSIVSKPIIVYAPPTLDFLTENNCSPQATLFKDVSAPNQDPAISRVWDFAGKGNGTGSSTQFAFPLPGTYNVKLTTSTQSGCSYSLTKSTIIVPAPIADFSTSIESGPPPLAVQFKNESKNATSYQWRFNDPNSSSSSLESPSFTYTTLGDFMVDLTASNVQGCVDTKSEKIHVIVPSSEVELEQFTLLLDQVTGSVRPVLSIRNNSNYTIKNLEVILDIAGNALVKEKINLTVLPNTTASQILKYELLPRNTKLDYLCVKLQLSDDRLSDETNLTDNSECISIESNEILFSPYPNPVTDQLNFDWIAEAPGSVKVSVVTQMGQLAYQNDISGVEVGLNQIVLDVSNLNSGFYMLIFESAGSRKTFPFVILN